MQNCGIAFGDVFKIRREATPSLCIQNFAFCIKKAPPRGEGPGRQGRGQREGLSCMKKRSIIVNIAQRGENVQRENV